MNLQVQVGAIVHTLGKSQKVGAGGRWGISPSEIVNGTRGLDDHQHYVVFLIPKVIYRIP